MAPSPPLSSSWRPLPPCPTSATPDPLAHARLNSGDLTAAERSSTARNRLFFPRSDPLRPIQIKRPGPRVPLHARVPDALARLLVPPAAVRPPGLIPSVRFRSNDPDRGYRFAHARLTPWPTCQRPSPLALGPLGQCALPLCR
jgi:hypothetical protein